MFYKPLICASNLLNLKKYILIYLKKYLFKVLNYFLYIQEITIFNLQVYDETHNFLITN